jgi:S1-C subfamily serine protease
LTNAHVVQNQVFVELRRFGESRKFVAQVEGVSHECDLALLKVKREEFFEGATPMRFGALPDLGDDVTVCGYPIGGDRLSLTRGVVSRIEVSPYAHSQRPLLAIQIDAAVNSGNSGGPVFKGDKIIGVAFQSLDESQNIAYAIPIPVVEHFLGEIDAGRRPIFPSLGIVWQRLESESQRRSLGLASRVGGVHVVRVAFESSAWGKLMEGDVLIAIDGETVDRDGTVILRKGELVEHSYRVALRSAGAEMKLSVIRDKKPIDVPVQLKAPALLVPEDRYDIKPTYFVFGGFLFAPLTRDYLKSWGHEWWKAAPHELLTVYETQIRTPARQEVVILQKVLADKVNQGYHEYENHVVMRIDGEPVANMRGLVDRVENGPSPFLTVELADGQRLVLDRKLARAANPVILDRFGVGQDRSIDLRRSAKPKKPATRRSARA